MTKKELRTDIKEKVKNEKENLSLYSQIVCKKIIDSEIYKKSEIILAYMALWDEVDLSCVIQQACSEGKKVYIPRIIPETNKMEFYQIKGDEKIESGSFGILEPDVCWNKFEIKNYDLNILGLIPGRAFSEAGDRLGRGKGFYDSFLSDMKRLNPKNFVATGICFKFQKVANVPLDAHDIKMDFVFSN